MNPKKIFLIADWIAFVVFPVVIGLLYIFGDSSLYKDFGEQSLNLLYVILFMKPIIVILGYKPLYQLLPYRRQLGIVSVRLALGHVIGMIISRNLRDVSTLLSHLLTNRYFIGVLAILGLLILGATSNFWALKKLGRNWKKIQRVAYPVLFLGILHADMKGVNPGSAYIATFLILFLFVGLKYREYKIRRRDWTTVLKIWNQRKDTFMGKNDS